MVLIHFSLIILSIFSCLLTQYIFFGECLFRSSVPILTEHFVFLPLNCKRSLNSLDTRRLSATCPCSVASLVSDSSRPHGLELAELFCPWDFPGKNTEVSCHFLLQGIFPAQESKPHLQRLLHCRQMLYHWATRKALIRYMI